jgi:hypothetical protein
MPSGWRWALLKLALFTLASRSRNGSVNHEASRLARRRVWSCGVPIFPTLYSADY